MKKIILGIIIAHATHCMEQQLTQAIKNGNVQEVQKFLAAMNKDHSENPEKQALMQESINVEALHALAVSLLHQKQATKETLLNSHVYKRLGSGFGTIGLSALTITLYFWNSAKNDNWDSVETMISILGAGSASIYHGAKEIHLGLTNHDAKHEHSNHLAIKHLTDDARKKISPEV